MTVGRLGGSLTRPIYRGRQFLLALRPLVSADDRAWAADILGEQAGLFFTMEKRDQRHALEVARRLVGAGVADRDLLAASLVHDCGKGVVPVWLRVLKVLSPRLVGVAAKETSRGWRGAAYRLSHHAEIGARLARATGLSAATARLISGRVTGAEETKLLLLQSADDAS